MDLRVLNNHLRHWEDWCGNLELAGVDVLSLGGSIEERLNCLGLRQLVRRDSIGLKSLFDNLGWLVGACLSQDCGLLLGGLEELGDLLEGVIELLLLGLLLFLFGADAELLQDPLALVTGGDSSIGVVEEGSQRVEFLKSKMVSSEVDIEGNAEGASKNEADKGSSCSQVLVVLLLGHWLLCGEHSAD